MALLLEWNYATLFELHSQVTPTLEICGEGERMKQLRLDTTYEPMTP